MRPPLFKLAGVLAEALLALFACKRHVEALQEGMVGRLGMAVCAVKPFPTAGRAYGDLCVQDVFAGGFVGLVWRSGSFIAIGRPEFFRRCPSSQRSKPISQLAM